MKVCSQCGYPNPDNIDVCFKCNSPLAQPMAQQAAQQNAQPQQPGGQPVSPSYYPPQITPQLRQPVRSFTEWWTAGFGVGTGLGCALMILVVIFGILSLFFGAAMLSSFRPKADPPPAYAPSQSAPYPNYPESIPEPPNPYTPR